MVGDSEEKLSSRTTHGGGKERAVLGGDKVAVERILRKKTARRAILLHRSVQGHDIVRHHLHARKCVRAIEPPLDGVRDFTVPSVFETRRTIIIHRVTNEDAMREGVNDK